MREQLLDLLACPECRSAWLEMETFERTEDDIIAGYILCAECRRFYFISEGIPRMLTEDYAELLDLSLAEKVPPAHKADLAAWRERVESPARSDRAAWGIEDVEQGSPRSR